LFNHSQQREAAKWGMGGKEMKKNIETIPKDGFAFGNPEDYKHLSLDEKKELTEKMKQKHKMWAGGQTPLGT